MPEQEITLETGLRHATETRRVLLESGALARTVEVFRDLFGAAGAAIVADGNTWRAAGERVAAGFRAADHATKAPLVFDDPHLYAEHARVEQVEQYLGSSQAIPVAVGSGTINDLVKLAAHRVGRSYLCVATAGSMDGYTAFGASITRNGSKQTFACPAPRGVVADLDVIRAAPRGMAAAGYADLLAKVTAGADWILADALGVEAIDPTAWTLVQTPLGTAIADPGGIAAGSEPAIRRLTEGLLMSGLAMQAHRSSRPASGAEHQFSHLWEMQGAANVSHGFKVGVASVMVARMYERLLAMPLERLDVENAVGRWRPWSEIEQRIGGQVHEPAIAEKAREEMQAKYIEREALRRQLELLRRLWPELREKLPRQLLPSEQLKRMLREAGAPTEAGEIGISQEQLCKSFRPAYWIRRRFTVLDLAARAGVMEECAEGVLRG